MGNEKKKNISEVICRPEDDRSESAVITRISTHDVADMSELADLWRQIVSCGGPRVVSNSVDI